VVLISFTGFTRVDHIDGVDVTTNYRGIFHVDGSKINWFSTDGWHSTSLLAQGMASILFCYVNHQMLFPLSMSLKRPTKKRFNKIINRVHLVEFIAYATIGITAYLLLLEHIDLHPIAPVVIASIPTKVVTFGKILMLAALFFAVPLNMFPARESLFEAF
jgi:amino acid permease